MSELIFSSLDDVALHLRATLEDGIEQSRNKVKNVSQILIFAYNGTGKTRLSMAFKDLGKFDDNRDTLYFNAFTEDLFLWDNDFENDEYRVLKINQSSRFFNGLQELEMENRIRPLLQRYADFDFFIDYEKGTINFTCQENTEFNKGIVENIKVSRGEENIFIWCFFLANLSSG